MSYNITKLSRLTAIALVIALFFQLALAEDQVVSVHRSYEAEKSFSLKSEALVKSHSCGKLGDLSIHGDGLTAMGTTSTGIPINIVSNGRSVQFSYVDVKNLINVFSDFTWKLADDGASRIDAYDWKKKIGKGGILVQRSYDGETWETVYTNTNVFAEYKSSIKNFYSAARSDLNEGSYYKVIIAYKAVKKKEQKNFLFIDTSSWRDTWNVDYYDFFLIADESSVTAANVDYSAFTTSDVSNAGDVGAVFGNQTTANRLAGEEAFNTTTGDGAHGFAAEAANMQAAAQQGILNGDTVEHTGADNAKYGSDYTITSSEGIITEIQSKYYSNASATLNACFDESGVFTYYTETGVPMAIEVPADQYDKVLILMQNKISQGLVPGVTDPADAENIIRQGAVTYKQAVNIAKAGNIDSLKFDAKNGCVSAASGFGVSAVVTFAAHVWNNDPVDIALKQSLYAGLKVGGNAFVTSVLSSQLARTGLNSLLVPGTEAIVEAIGPKAAAVIVNATRIGAKPIYGAAAMKSAAKLLRGNVITGTVSLIVFSVPDIVDIFRGRISGKQLLKNVAETAGGIGGGMAGAAGGAALGTAIFPGVGTVVGGVVGAIGGGIGGAAGVDAIADLIAEDDADEMLDILTVEFQNLAEEYLLNGDEAEKVSTALQSELDANRLKDMFSSKDQHKYARDMVEKLVKAEVKRRKTVTLPSDEELADTLVEVLEDIADEAGLEVEDAK